MPDYCEICADERPTVARLVDVHNNLWEYYCEKCDPFINLTITTLKQERDVLLHEKEILTFENKRKRIRGDGLESDLADHKRVLGELVEYVDNPPAGSFTIMWAALEGIAVEARKLLEVK